MYSGACTLTLLRPPVLSLAAFAVGDEVGIVAAASESPAAVASSSSLTLLLLDLLLLLFDPLLFDDLDDGYNINEKNGQKGSVF